MSSGRVDVEEPAVQVAGEHARGRTLEQTAVVHPLGVRLPQRALGDVGEPLGDPVNLLLRLIELEGDADQRVGQHHLRDELLGPVELIGVDQRGRADGFGGLVRDHAQAELGGESAQDGQAFLAREARHRRAALGQPVEHGAAIAVRRTGIDPGIGRGRCRVVRHAGTPLIHLSVAFVQRQTSASVQYSVLLSAAQARS